VRACVCVCSLVERRRQWQRDAEERRAREAEAEVPAGHRLMPDDERVQTLDHVQHSTYEYMHYTTPAQLTASPAAAAKCTPSSQHCHQCTTVLLFTSINTKVVPKQVS